MNVKTVVMDNVYNTNGTLIVGDLMYVINEANEYIQDYVNITLTSVVEEKLMGVYSRKDLVGDLRRGMLFLQLIKKEMLNDEFNKVENLWNYYIEKYETEKYRDYLICKGVDSEIVDGLFNIIDLNYYYKLVEPVDPDHPGDPDIPIEDTGIGSMDIEGNNFPFKIY